MKNWKSCLLYLFFGMFIIASVQEVCYAPPPGPPGGGPTPPGGTPPDRGPVPEPATAVLIALGAAGVYGYKKLSDRCNRKEP